MIIVPLVGLQLVLTATYYESRESVVFATLDREMSFAIQLKASGPLTACKDVNVRNFQVLAFPQEEITGFFLLLIRGQPDRSLWLIQINRSVNYPVGGDVNAFFDGTPDDGSIQFTQPGVQNVTASLWLQPGTRWEPIAPDGDASVVVLPKEADDAWNAGRYALLGIVVSAAVFAVPATVKVMRDLYHGAPGDSDEELTMRGPPRP